MRPPKELKGPQRCPICFRSKEESLNQQLTIGKTCDNVNCIFKDEILSLLNHRTIRIKSNESRYCTRCGKRFSINTKELFCTKCGRMRKVYGKQ